MAAGSGWTHALRSLSDIDRSTAANDPRSSALFSALKNPQRTPVNTPPVFCGPAASHLAASPSPRHEGNIGQPPRKPEGPRKFSARTVTKKIPDPFVSPGISCRRSVNSLPSIGYLVTACPAVGNQHNTTSVNGVKPVYGLRTPAGLG